MTRFRVGMPMQAQVTIEEATSMATRDKRVIGDTPEHGKYLIEDTGTGTTATSSGGLAFALGVAALEAEMCREDARSWGVKHPNGALLYIIKFDVGSSQTIITKVF